MAKKQKKYSSTSSATTGIGKRHSTVQEFNPDYTNIINDLKIIGILALSFTGILIILSFILN